VAALCLVPTPLAAARAARRLCDAQGGVLFGPAVSTLDRLLPGLLAAGGDRRAILTPLAERLLAAEAGAAAGGSFAALSPDSGLAAALAAALAELRRGEVSAGEARRAAEELRGAPAARLRALADALQAWEARLDALDAHDRAGATRAAAAVARRGASSPETSGLDLLVVDGIVALAPAEWDLLAALVARTARTRVHVPFFPDRPELSSPAEPLLRRLEGLHELAARRELEVVLPRLEGEGRAGAAAALLAAFAGGRAPPRSPGGRVLARAGAGEEGEPAAVAAAVAELLEAGFAPGEVAVVVPAPRRTGPALARAFGALGIPFASGRGPGLDGLPLVRAVRTALESAGAVGRQAAERLLGSGWLAPPGLGAPGPLLDRAGAIEGRFPAAAALRRRAASLGAGAPSGERRSLVRAAEALEGLAAALRPLAVPGTAREQATRLAAFLDRSGLRRRAARGEPEQAAADLAALARLEEAAEEVVRAQALLGRGGERLAPDAFRARLGVAIERAALPPPAEPAAGAVELWGLDEAPGLSVRAAVVAGCALGAFPAPPPPEPLLREPERLALNRLLRRAAVPLAAARRAEALHRAFSAAAAGREAIAFTWPAPGPAGGGGPPAPAGADARAAAGLAAPAGPPPEPGLGAARTARAALRAAARLGPAALAALEGSPLAARARDALRRGAIEVERGGAVLARAAAPHAGRIGEGGAAALAAALPEEWAPTQLELYARCPFRAFLRVLARLPDAAAPDLDIDPRDEGSLLHAILEQFVGGRIARRAWPPSGGAEDLAEARAAAEGVLARFEREGRVGDPAAWAPRREAILARVERLVRAEAEGADALVPAAVEHRFGGGAPAPPLALSWQGEEVLLRGRIDRIDAGPDRLRVVDYKNARNGEVYAGELSPEAFGETSFQIPAYLMAAARAFPGRSHLEATYALLRRAERLEPVGLAAGDPVLAAAAPAASPGARPFAAAVVQAVRRIRAGEFPIASRGCEHCPHGAVCRFQGTAEASVEGGP